MYILARILHDWPDEKVHLLLSKIADACTPGKILKAISAFLFCTGKLAAISYQLKVKSSVKSAAVCLKTASVTCYHQCSADGKDKNEITIVK